MLDDLWVAYRLEPTTEVRDRLVEAYLPLVAAVAGSVWRRWFRRSTTAFDEGDLRAWGAEGLLEAIRNYDPDRHTAFPRFASARIRGRMLDEVRELSWVPRVAVRQIEALRRADEALASDGTAVTVAALATHLGWTQAEVRERQAKAWKAETVRLSAPVKGAEGGDPSGMATVADLLEATTDVEAEALEAMAAAVLAAHMAAAVARLPPRYRHVIHEYFHEGRRLAAIGADLGVSDARVCQMKKAALTSMRARWPAEAERAPAR